MSEKSFVTLTFSGELDIGRYPEFRDAFEKERHGGAHNVLVDLSGATHVDSIFLSEVMLFARAMRRSGRKVAVQTSPHSVAKVFALAELDERVEVYGSRETAVAALGGEGAAFIEPVADAPAAVEPSEPERPAKDPEPA